MQKVSYPDFDVLPYRFNDISKTIIKQFIINLNNEELHTFIIKGSGDRYYLLQRLDGDTNIISLGEYNSLSTELEFITKRDNIHDYSSIYNISRGGVVNCDISVSDLWDFKIFYVFSVLNHLGGVDVDLFTYIVGVKDRLYLIQGRVTSEFINAIEDTTEVPRNIVIRNGIEKIYLGKIDESVMKYLS